MKSYAILCFSLSALAGLSSCSSEAQPSAEAAEPEEAAPLSVTTASVAERMMDQTIEVVGSLGARERVELSFEVAGRLQQIGVDFGDRVREGRTVARLDPAEYTLRVKRTQASLAQALAQIGLSADGDPEAVETTPAMEQARAQLEDAESKFESAKALAETGDISRNRFTEIEKAFSARQASFEAAQHDLRRRQAQVAALQADLELAQKDLSETELRAPFAGEILERMASPGQYLKENTPVATLVKTRPLRLRALVPETAAGFVREGQAIVFRTDALGAKEFGGTITKVSPSLDPEARTLEVEARVRDSDPRLRPGMFAKLSIVINKDAPVLMAPEEAIYSIAGLNKLFIVKNGTVSEQPISPGKRAGGWVELRGAGLSPGDIVATSQLDQLHEGRKVRVRG